MFRLMIVYRRLYTPETILSYTHIYWPIPCTMDCYVNDTSSYRWTCEISDPCRCYQGISRPNTCQGVRVLGNRRKCFREIFICRMFLLCFSLMIVYRRLYTPEGILSYTHTYNDLYLVLWTVKWIIHRLIAELVILAIRVGVIKEFQDQIPAKGWGFWEIIESVFVKYLYVGCSFYVSSYDSI
jgi:hypothetical protein